MLNWRGVEINSWKREALPWVPEVSRCPLRDLPAEGRPTNERRRATIETLTETGNRAIQTSGTQGKEAPAEK